jgi:VWFA-related protein
MRRAKLVSSLAAILIILPGFSAPAQSPPRAPQRGEAIKLPEEQQAAEAIRIDTTLVTVPVIASDRNDVYVHDLQQAEFSLYEDGVKQEIVFFATIKTPFHVVLMLDTSASTQEKLKQIQRAAVTFVNQLQMADRVKIISFDDEVRELSDFTNNRAELRRAIEATRSGQGTRLYDAMRLAMANLAQVKGRKAIVLFTDGVDWYSNDATYDSNLREIEESGIIVYPIRYDTRAETERMLRQQRDSGKEVELGVIWGGPPIGQTPPTVPGKSPGGRTGGQRDPYNLPIPPIIITRTPSDRYPDDRFPDSRTPDARSPGRREDSTTIELDGLYRTADRYLEELALKSGGKLHRADTLISLPDAFKQIAEELRNQYSLGYYPTNSKHDGRYRKIQVRVSRKGVLIRARPGYRVPAESKRANMG